MKPRSRLLLVVPAGLSIAVLLGLFLSLRPRGGADLAPEGSSGRRAVEALDAEGFMVVAAHPLASRAGLEVLDAGGAAIDAAVAVQAMLTLVEPQSSGIGGGAFMLHFDAARGELDAFDGRETAPSSVTPGLFVQPDGEPYGFLEALVGGRSVGTPGVLRMLEDAHRWHGRLPWARLFEPAIRAARSGFEVTPRLHRLLEADPVLRLMPEARRLFFDVEGRARPVGAPLSNPELAEVLESVAKGGADAFYEGPIADAMVEAVRAAVQPSEWLIGVERAVAALGFEGGSGWLASDPAPGALTKEDLSGYVAELRDPLCADYRAYRICGHPPPTSGGITTLQIFGILSHFDLGALGPESVEAAHLLVESGRLAFADRAAWVGDPAFVDVPVEGLLDPAYLEARARLIQRDRALDEVHPGALSGREGAQFPRTTDGLPSTSHFSIVDAAGNVVSMTTSVENVFGSRLVVRGFVLNNQLTDFAFVPERAGRAVPNAVAARKRPRSSMSPLVVFDRATGRPVLAIGSPGGSRIIAYVVRATVAILDWGLGPQDAVGLPHIVGREGPAELEDEGWAPGALERVRDGLTQLGHRVVVGPQTSGLHAIRLGQDGRLSAGVDPRREGLALGPSVSDR